MTVEIVEASPGDRETISAFLDDYLRELADFREVPTGPTSARDYPYLDAYFRESGRYPFLILWEGRTVGFALIRDPESTGGRWEVAELYVDTGSRRRGVGREAIEMIWGRFPGDWEVAVHARNEPARRFWSASIYAAASGRVTVENLVASDGGRISFQFRVAPMSAS